MSYLLLSAMSLCGLQPITELEKTQLASHTHALYRASLVKKGMTSEEVRKILGPPYKTHGELGWGFRGWSVDCHDPLDTEVEYSIESTEQDFAADENMLPAVKESVSDVRVRRLPDFSVLFRFRDCRSSTRN